MDLDQYNRLVGSTAEDFAEMSLDIGMLFPWQVYRMNMLYRLPANDFPTLDGLHESPIKRMKDFLACMKVEMEKGSEILTLIQAREAFDNDENIDNSMLHDLAKQNGLSEKATVAVTNLVTTIIGGGHELDMHEELSRACIVGMSSWLGNMAVQIRSEALKYGIPLESVLACIMGSNFTRVAEDGSVVREKGKVQDGPDFIPPEEYIYATMFDSSLVGEAEEVVSHASELGYVTMPILNDPMRDIFGMTDSDEVTLIEDEEVEEDDENDDR